MKKRILFYDIESSPYLGYTWGKYEQNVLAFTREREILSIAFKWDGSDKIECLSRPNFTTEKSLLKSFLSVASTADIVVAHNGISFDNKVVNTRLALHRIKPPATWANVDTLREARRYFAFSSNKLDDLAQFLGVGRKLALPGISLWTDCLANKSDAWELMTRYNKHDVFLLQGVYKVLLPWMQTHPNVNYPGNEQCPNCGGKSIKNGFSFTASKRYQRYQCLGCGRSFKSRKAFKEGE